MSSYETYIEEMLKLQRCYRIQNILSSDIISKIDLVSKPKIALTLSIALWCVAKIKQSSLSYSDVVYLQRRLAQFLLDGSKRDIGIIKRLFDLIPMRYGMNVSLAARRCGLSEQHLVDIVRALNIIRDVIDMTSIATEINEPIKHSYTTCLNDVDLLPPTASNPKEYLWIIIKALKENTNRVLDPLIQQVIELLYRETKGIDLELNDIAAIALITKLIAENVKSHIICVDPSVNMATLSQKLLNDLAMLGVVPYDSDFYKLYQDMSMKSVVYGSHK